MRSHIRLGRFFGVEVGLHYSWAIIAVLIATSLAGRFQSMHPDWARSTVWASAALTSLLFFLALVGHELAHSWVAISRGLPVRSITLFALGGVAQIEGESPDAKTEFWMAIAGPVASAVIGVACLAGSRAVAGPETPLVAVLTWLGYINLSLAVFNMIPGFPLDGGRVLRAILWGITGNPLRATRIAAQTGRVVAIGFMALGVYRYLAGAGFGGLWIAFIGWFLLDAAGSSYTQVRLTEALQGATAGDVMVHDCPVVDARGDLESFARTHLVEGGAQFFLVTRDGAIAGLLTLADVRRVPAPQRPFHSVGDAMQPIEEIPVIPPEMSLTQAMETMTRNRLNELAVTEGGRVAGVITRTGLLDFLKKKARIRG